MALKYIDLTHTIHDNMPVFPGDVSVRLQATCTIEQNGVANHLLSCSVHTGTHIDAPGHFLLEGKNIIDFPVSTFIGKAVCLDVRGLQVIERKHLEGKISVDDIVVLHTGFDKQFYDPSYFYDYPVLDASCADYLIEQQIKMIGLDCASVDKQPFAIHKKLLSHDILIIENLIGLEQLLDYSNIELIALPLKIDAHGALARVVARVA